MHCRNCVGFLGETVTFCYSNGSDSPHRRRRRSIHRIRQVAPMCTAPSHAWFLGTHASLPSNGTAGFAGLTDVTNKQTGDRPRCVVTPVATARMPVLAMRRTRALFSGSLPYGLDCSPL